MKSWEPDQSFDKVDFPSSRSRKAADEPKKEKGGASRSVPPDTPRSRNEPSSNPGGGGARAKKITSFSVDENRRWQPARVEDGANVIKSRAAEAKPSVNASTREVDGFTRKLVRDAALSDAANTLRFMRRWYFEKWKPGSGEGVKAIAPHDRLEIVCNALGEEALGYFFKMMSPLERANFGKIIVRQRLFNPATIQLVCREFMEALQSRH